MSLRHAVQAVHLERVARALGQLVERFGDVFEGRKVDVGGFWRGILDHHIHAFFLATRVLQLHRLLAVVIDGQVAHDLEQIAELGLERGRDLRCGTEPEEGILHHILGARPTARDTGGNLDEDAAIVDERLE